MDRDERGYVIVWWMIFWMGGNLFREWVFGEVDERNKKR